MSKGLTEQQKKNRQEDRRALKKFWVMMIVALLTGIVLGMLSAFLGDITEMPIADSLVAGIKVAAVYGGFVYTTVLGIICILLCRKSRQEYTAWAEEDEDVLNSIESKISYVVWFGNLIMYGSYFFFSAGVWATGTGTDQWKETGEVPIAGLVAMFVHIVYALAVGSIAQQKAVNLEKEINPEKAGSIFDMKFNRKWLESSDEAEKFTTYKCAYHSFKVMQIAGIILWLVCLIGQMSFGTGAFATIMVTILLLIQVSSYSIQAIYFAKHPSEVMK